MKKEVKEKILSKRWERLEDEGIDRPENPEENQQRAKDAHIPESVK